MAFGESELEVNGLRCYSWAVRLPCDRQWLRGYSDNDLIMVCGKLRWISTSPHRQKTLSRFPMISSAGEMKETDGIASRHVVLLLFCHIREDSFEKLP